MWCVEVTAELVARASRGCVSLQTLTVGGDEYQGRLHAGPVFDLCRLTDDSTLEEVRVLLRVSLCLCLPVVLLVMCASRPQACRRVLGACVCLALQAALVRQKIHIRPRLGGRKPTGSKAGARASSSGAGAGTRGRGTRRAVTSVGALLDAMPPGASASFVDEAVAPIAPPERKRTPVRVL